VRKPQTGTRAPAGLGGRAALLFLSVLLMASVPSVGQEAVIDELRVEGNDFISDEAFLALTSISVGDPFDVKRVRGEFRKVWNSGLFENLRIEAEPGTRGGVTLIFVVEEKPRVDSVRYEKTEALAPRKITEALEQNGLSIRSGEPVDEAKISQNVKLIEELLSREGYTDATVEVVREDVSRHRVSLFFSIDPGLRSRIKEIHFEGNTVMKDGRLRKIMKETSEHWVGSLFTSHDVYYPTRLQGDLESIVAEYKKKGYLDIRIGEPRLDDLGKSEKKERRWVSLTIPINEGPLYTLGDVKFSGNEVFSSPELRILVPVQPGEMVNDSLVQLGRSRIENVYGDAGYIFVSAPHIYERRQDQEGVADLVYRINEDRKFFVNRIDFEGNVKTKDAVLRREMRLMEGDVFRRRDFNLSLRKIAQLGTFQLDPDTPTVEKVSPTSDRVNVTIRGEEVSRNELQFGGGYSGLDGFFATASFSSRNFLGRGESLSASVQLGGRSQRGSIQYVIPYVFHSRNTLGFSLFIRDLEYTDFNRKGQGGQVWMQFPFHNFSLWSLLYRYEDNEVTADDDIAGVVANDVVTGSITPAYLLDSRNNPFKPTVGNRLRASMEVASEALGGDINFYKPIVASSWRFGQKQVPGRTRPSPYFAVNIEAGFLGSPDDDVPVFERFFLGGEQSLRAFETRTISPVIRNKVTGAVSYLGGNQFYQGNFEYAIPLNDFFEVVTFLDFGNAWGTDYIDPLSLIDFDPDGDGFPDYTPDDFEILDNDAFSDIRYSAGVETRFYTPVFILPVRLIFGCNLDPRPGETQCEFQFSIGRTFD